MIVIGLTGSIGMGKSTVLAMFEELGAAVWNADDAVHRLYAEGGAGVDPVTKEFPQVLAGGAIDRERLGAIVLNDPARLKKLEAIVHPLVAIDRETFLALAREKNTGLVVLDIPLLFESGAEKSFDAVVVVSAPYEIQRARVLARPGMTEEKFLAILGKQTPDEQKRARADYVVNTGQSLEATRKEVEKIFRAVKRAKTSSEASPQCPDDQES